MRRAGGDEKGPRRRNRGQEPRHSPLPPDDRLWLGGLQLLLPLPLEGARHQQCRSGNQPPLPDVAKGSSRPQEGLLSCP